jgi:hypothetical protein
MQRFTIRKRKGEDKSYAMVWVGLDCSAFQLFFLYWSGVPGGGKCPEEEHTTCSGGPTINCHKRGLWGERNIYDKIS